MNIPFNKPYLTGNETIYIEEAVKSGKISGNGLFTQKCQTYFEEQYGFKKALLTTSCTDALEMCAILANIQPNDEVIIPSYTFVSTALAFVRQGAKIVFADSCSDNPNIDTNKIVVMGGSSGGHLALMTGLLGNDRRFDTNCYFDGDIKVAAIIDKYGVSNLLLLSYWKSAKNWLGTNYNNKNFIESVSPVFHVSATSPPIFIVHGDEDPTVPYSQSEELYKKLKDYNITA